MSRAGQRRLACRAAIAADGASRRALAHRSAFRRCDTSGACCARLRWRRRRGDRRRAQGGLWRHCATLRPHQRRQGSGQALAVRPLLRSMSALSLRRPGCGVCPTKPAGFAGPARQRRPCDPRAAGPRHSFRISCPAKSGSGASPRSLTVVRRARFGVRTHSFRLAVYHSCLFSVSACPRARLPARSSR
jgi:hypothetical protein